MDTSVVRRQEPCVKCGYSLLGLPRVGICPECGEWYACPKWDDNPGSPWQLDSTFVSWVRTNALALRRPRELWPMVRARPRSDLDLYFTNLVVGVGLAAALGACVFYLIQRALSLYHVDGVVFLYFVHCAALAASPLGARLVFAVLYCSELTPLQLRESKWAISTGFAHASAGYLLMPLVVVPWIAFVWVCVSAGVRPWDIDAHPALAAVFYALAALPILAPFVAYGVLIKSWARSRL